MRINITTPPEITYREIILKTRRYFHLKRSVNLIEDDEKRYYIFIKRRSIHIEIVSDETETVQEITSYLNYIFRNSYIGIPKSYFGMFKLQDVRMFEM